jgi:serine/threonine protein kinase
LADRLRSGPIPIDETLSIAKQISEALEAAHEKGIVHRDLKPANIKITPDGEVKVLDFGLAKIFTEEAAIAALSQSPTLMSAASTPGMILGTAAYMSPEQARGRNVDKRTDIWAFGTVVFEMLTGMAAFDGEAVADVLGAIVHKEPDWKRLPLETPPDIRRLLRSCLAKDARQRLHDIADARIEIDAASEEAPIQTSAATPATGLRKQIWLLVVTVAVVAGLAFFSGRSVGTAQREETTVQTEIWNGREY